MDIVSRNEKLVYHIYHRYFSKYYQLKDDLISEGFLALCRAAIHFDETRGIKESTYFSKAIHRAMFKFILKEQKHFNNFSLDETINDEEDVRLIDLISTNSDIVGDLLAEQSILQTLNKADSKTKQIINLYSIGYTQQQIAEMLNMSQAHVSRIITKFKIACEEVVD